MSYVLYMTSPNSVDPVLFERTLRTAASASAIDELCREHGWKVRPGIYSLVVVIWLMIYQRLNSKRTLSSAVQFLARHADQWQDQAHVGKRVRERRISTRTGGYCQARCKMPTLVASSVCDHIFEQLQVRMREQLPDGLPADAVVLADGNFAIFVFAYAVQQTQRPMLLRLTTARAQKVLGGNGLRPGRRRKVEWKASRWECKQHPNLPAGAVVKGWVVACRNPARKKEILYFFTTLDLKPRRILALYKLRWNMETDLRSLKRTVGLHQVTSKSKAMVEKEVLMAVCAYNVLRAVMYLSASGAGLTPRQLSFSGTQDAVMAAWPFLRRAHTQAQWHDELQRLLQAVAQTKLPQRSGKRSYP